jgi:hypothetical protein
MCQRDQQNHQWGRDVAYIRHPFARKYSSVLQYDAEQRYITISSPSYQRGLLDDLFKIQ